MYYREKAGKEGEEELNEMKAGGICLISAEKYYTFSLYNLLYQCLSEGISK